MLIEFGTQIGNGFDVVSSYNEDTLMWTTQVYDAHQRPVGDPVLSRTEDDAKFDHGQVTKAFNNLYISGYAKHNSKLN